MVKKKFSFKFEKIVCQLQLRQQIEKSVQLRDIYTSIQTQNEQYDVYWWRWKMK